MTALIDLLPQILEKTNEGKLEWEPLSGDNFIARLGDASLEVAEVRGEARLWLRDANGRVLESLRWEDILSPADELLSQLYRQARRRALRVAETIESLEDKLKRL